MIESAGTGRPSWVLVRRRARLDEIISTLRSAFRPASSGFAFATFTPNLYFGVMTAIVVTAALITDLTFLPALLPGSQKPGKS